MRTMRRVALLLFTALILGGCIGAEEDVEGEEREQEEAQSGLAIHGRVFTEDLEAITGAYVVVVGSDDRSVDSKTDENGGYRVAGLAPDLYRVQVNAPCCHQTVQAVKLEDDDRELDLMLEPFTAIELQVPFTEEGSWEGFFGCGTASVVLLVQYSCNDPNHNRAHRFEIQPGLKTLLITMDWEEGFNFADSYRLYVTRIIEGSRNHGYMTLHGEPPLEGRLDASELEGGSAFDNLTEGEWTIAFSVWAGSSVNLVYQQPFTVEYALHYWEGAPEGARAGKE